MYLTYLMLGHKCVPINQPYKNGPQSDRFYYFEYKLVHFEANRLARYKPGVVRER